MASRYIPSATSIEIPLRDTDEVSAANGSPQCCRALFSVFQLERILTLYL